MAALPPRFLLDEPASCPGDACEHLKLRYQCDRAVPLDELDVDLNSLAVRVVVRSSGVSHEFPLPRAVAVQAAEVTRSRRAHELRFRLPVAGDAKPALPLLSGPSLRNAVPGSSQPEAVAAGLGKLGFHVVDGFMGGCLSQRVADLAIRWQESGRLAPGVVGNAAAPMAPLKKVRGDVITNLKDDDNTDVAALLHKMDSLVLALGQRLPKLRNVAKRSRAMLAVYPAGSHGYIRHIDNRPGSDPNDHRRLTCIYYLNAEWCEADGGDLVLHLGDESVKVSPSADRFACFWADSVLHEVLPTHGRHRAAVSAWYSEDVANVDLSISPQRQLPIQAVHAMAAQLETDGAIRLAQWITPPMGPLSEDELFLASQGLVPLLGEGSQFTLGAVYGSSPALHGALDKLSNVSAQCYYDTSRAVASCVEVAERMIAMLRESKAPGWTHAGAANPCRGISLERGGGSSSLQDATLCCCVFGLGAEGGELCSLRLDRGDMVMQKAASKRSSARSQQQQDVSSLRGRRGTEQLRLVVAF